MVMIMFVGFSIGAALGGLLAAGVLIIRNFGWRSVFVVGGVAPLLFGPGPGAEIAGGQCGFPRVQRSGRCAGRTTARA